MSYVSKPMNCTACPLSVSVVPEAFTNAVEFVVPPVGATDVVVVGPTTVVVVEVTPGESPIPTGAVVVVVLMVVVVVVFTVVVVLQDGPPVLKLRCLKENQPALFLGFELLLVG